MEFTKIGGALNFYNLFEPFFQYSKTYKWILKGCLMLYYSIILQDQNVSNKINGVYLNLKTKKQTYWQKLEL